MRFSSLLGTPYYGNRNCNNQDTWCRPSAIIPQAPAPRACRRATASSPYGNANISIALVRRPPADHSATSIPMQRHARLFRRLVELCHDARRRRACKSNTGTSTSYAQTVGQVLNIASPGNSTYNATFETKGYAGLQ